MAENKYFIIDFDSTITRVEALDELARIALKGRPGKEKILKNVKSITNLGMEGKISFPESLSRRIDLLRADKNHINTLIKSLKKRLSKSFLRNRNFFKQYRNSIYIISGGFKEFIVPVLKPYGIPEEHIYANTFCFGKKGNITGVDKRNLLAQENGKARQLKALGLKGEVSILGDGYTDYQMKEAVDFQRVSGKFFAFTENIERKSAIQKADHVAPSFDEFLYVSKLPMSVSYPKNRIRVLLLENISREASLKLKNEGFTVETMSHGLGEDELIERIRNVYVLGIRSRTQVSDRALSNAKKLTAIGTFCAGTSHIDLNSSLRRGVPVFNAPYSNTRSVAELVIGEIIMLLRNIFDKNKKLHQGAWEKTPGSSFEVRGKKLGVIGYGNIGSQVSVLAEALGMNVYYFDIIDKLSLGNARKCKSMQELLRKADIVTVHVDGNPRNINLIGEKEFRAMKDGSFFLNLSRGNVVDIKQLASCIRSGKIRGAAIDVFPEEPRSDREKFVSKLKNLPNVIMTPHIGGNTQEAQENIARFVSERLIDYINTGNTLYSANFPQVKLPVLRNSHRFLHIHKNIPGMLSQINAVLSKNRINIEGQYLKTNEEIGYVITDIYAKYDTRVIEALRKTPGTIKFRVLY